jgi:hypothetical protein
VPWRVEPALMAMIAERQGSIAQSLIPGFDIQALVASYQPRNSLILLQKKGNAAL